MSFVELREPEGFTESRSEPEKNCNPQFKFNLFFKEIFKEIFHKVFNRFLRNACHDAGLR